MDEVTKELEQLHEETELLKSKVSNSGNMTQEEVEKINEDLINVLNKLSLFIGKLQ